MKGPSLRVMDENGNVLEFDAKTARAIAAEVGEAVATWRAEAARLGVSVPEIDRTASAFEHEDLPGALKPRSPAGKADG